MNDQAPVALDIGDNVRIRDAEATRSLGLVGLPGVVHGWTTVSSTNPDVIGKVTDDQAVNVFFDDREEGFWFAPDLVEFVDHGAGATATIGDKSFVRQADGSWKEA